MYISIKIQKSKLSPRGGLRRFEIEKVSDDKRNVYGLFHDFSTSTILLMVRTMNQFIFHAHKRRNIPDHSRM